MVKQPDMLLERERAARRGEPTTPTIIRLSESGPKLEACDNLAELARKILEAVGDRPLLDPIRSVFSFPGFDTIEGFGLHVGPGRDWIACVAIMGRPVEHLVAAISEARARAAAPQRVPA